MSRSNPTDRNPNPATRWFEWDGENGGIRYYDKETKQNIQIGDKMTFILLDELATIKGWHNDSDSGIYSNEVKDTMAETMIVKAFKGGVIAQGFYRQIRDRVAAAGGKFVNNCYVAFKDQTLQIGSVQFKGAALNAWVEFKKAHRSELMKKAVSITGFEKGKKGKIEYCIPTFAIKEITEDTNEAATELDRQLQSYLKQYFQRSRVDQVAQPPADSEEDHSQERREPEPDPADLHRKTPPPDPDLDAPEEDIPF